MMNALAWRESRLAFEIANPKESVGCKSSFWDIGTDASTQFFTTCLVYEQD
jgi:hypothetical protein